jgi:hypothetical protein
MKPGRRRIADSQGVRQVLVDLRVEGVLTFTLPLLVRELRERLGISRASAYRALRRAHLEGVINLGPFYTMREDIWDVVSCPEGVLRQFEALRKQQITGGPSMGYRKGESGNRAGRPRGARDKVPRSAVRAAFQDFIERANGEGAMRKAIEAGVKGGGRLALGYCELAAKILDRTKQPENTRIVFECPLDPRRLQHLPKKGSKRKELGNEHWSLILNQCMRHSAGF